MATTQFTHSKGNIIMAKKVQPVSVNITGSQQAETIENVFSAKEQADAAKATYDTTRTEAMPLILGKILKHWAKVGQKHTGAYEFALPNGTTRTVNVQNRQSTKVCDPSEAKEIMAKLNANCGPDSQLKPSDVYNVVTDHSIHPVAMKSGKIRARVIETLLALEAQMKEEGSLAPEVSLIQEDKKLVLAEHALDRLLALSDNFESGLDVVR